MAKMNHSEEGYSREYRSMEEMVHHVFGEETRIERTDRVCGGDINDAYRVTLSGGEHIFVKTNSIRNHAFFRTESRGLDALGALGEIGVPKILGTGADEGRGVSFLALEYIDSAPRIDTYWETFGHELARLHRAECRAFAASGEKQGKSRLRYGFPEDNFIGASPQKNSPKEKWTDFYRECRILPQLKQAEHYLGADLAMTQLFGSLPERFYEAYSEVNPIDGKGYAERKKLYDLYHLLNHLNLFGRSYLSSVAGIILEYV